MSNDDEHKSNVLLSNFDNRVHLLINNKKYKEVHQLLDLKLKHIIPHHEFGALFRESNIFKRKDNIQVWDLCRRKLNRFRISIKKEIINITQETYPPNHSPDSSPISPINMSNRKRFRSDVDDTSSLPDLGNFEFSPSMLSPSIFSPAQNVVQQPYEGTNNLFKSPEGRRLLNTVKTNLFNIPEQEELMMKNNSSNGISKLVSSSARNEDPHGVYLAFFESGVEQDSSKLFAKITGNEEIDDLINMDEDDINQLGINMNKPNAKASQKAAKVAQKFKLNREAIGNFILDMDSHWFENTGKMTRNRRMDCEAQIKQMEEQIKQRKEIMRKMDDIDKYSKSLRDNMLKEKVKMDNVNDKIIGLETGRVTPNHQMSDI